jgi:RNA polymerase sigma-70 factor (ECF subfamily)
MKTACLERCTQNDETSTLTDEQLLVAYCEEGCDQSFADLVQRYNRQLYVFLRPILQNESLTEDVLQATFLQLHRKCKQFEPGRKVRPWLYAIARNKAIDATRREKKHARQSIDENRHAEGESSLVHGIPADEPGPYDRCVTQERAQALWAAVGRLPERLRLAIQLVHFDGLMYREAADALSIPVGTLKSRMHTATKELELTLQHSGLVTAQ